MLQVSQLSGLSSEIFILLDIGRVVVVHPRSTLTLLRLVAPPQNVEFENVMNCFFRRSAGRQDELIKVKVGREESIMSLL